jgi:hypothetical protein
MILGIFCIGVLLFTLCLVGWDLFTPNGETFFGDNKKLKKINKSLDATNGRLALDNAKLRQENEALKILVGWPSVEQYESEKNEILEKVKKSLEEGK